MSWKFVWWSKLTLSMKLQEKQVIGDLKTGLTLLQDTVLSKRFGSCYFKPKMLGDVVLICTTETWIVSDGLSTLSKHWCVPYSLMKIMLLFFFLFFCLRRKPSISVGRLHKSVTWNRVLKKIAKVIWQKKCSFAVLQIWPVGHNLPPTSNGFLHHSTPSWKTPSPFLLPSLS